MSHSRFLDYRYSLLRKKRLVSKWLFPKREISSLQHSTFQSDHEEMKRVFQKIDADGDGLISRGDLGSLLKALGVTYSETTVENIMRVAEADDGGSIPFEKFFEINRTVGAPEIRAAFRFFDCDGDENIGAGDLKMAMERLGEKCSVDDCRKMIRSLNPSDVEMVSIGDFMAMMTATLKPMPD